MIDRELPVTEDELHAYVDGELPADRRTPSIGVACDASGRCGAGRRLARAGRRDPRALRRGRQTSRCRHASISTQLMRAGAAPWSRMPRRPPLRASLSAAAAGWFARGAIGTAPSRVARVTSRGARCPPALRRRGASSGRSAGRERAHLTQWLSKPLGYEHAHSRPASDRIEAGRRAAAAGPAAAPPPSSCMRARRASASRSTAAHQRAARRRCATRTANASPPFYWVDDERRLCGERAGRP